MTDRNHQIIDNPQIANLFLIAAPRSGSTQLAAWLETHPDVTVSTIKEPNFFSNHEFTETYIKEHQLNDVDPETYAKQSKTTPMQFAVFRDLDNYSYLFRSMRTRWRLDASTTYLHCPEAPLGIRKYAPNAKIIILLRDPLARAMSHYMLQLRIGRRVPSISDQIDSERSGELPIPGHFLLRPSEISESVHRYKEVFGQNALIVFAEEMFENPSEQMNRIAEFLSIRPEFDLSKDSSNASALPRFSGLNSFMHRTGILLALRRLVPRTVKRKLSKLYYRETVTSSEHPHGRDLLETALSSQIEAYRKLKSNA